MSKQDLEASFATLKQTIPLLLKHAIPAVPTNYALWYTYVTQESDALNAALDHSIENKLPISDVQAKSLYREHLAEKQEVDAWQLRQSLEAMLIEMSHSMQDTKADTQQFKAVIDKNLDNLNRVEREGLSVQEVMGLVKTMVKEAQSMRQTTMLFNQSLEAAEKEIAELRSQLKASQQDALYDALTGLCNRRYFDSELQAKYALPSLTLIFADIDYFKKINDEHGHQMGDLVLKAVARKLQSCCRDSAQVFRYGGEEFAVIVPNKTLKQTRSMAEMMRKTVEKIAVKDRRSGETLGDITISIGLAEKPLKGDAQKLLELADKQLYEAKRLGRNRVMPML